MHFVVMVVGDDYEAQLAPYDENDRYDYESAEEELAYYQDLENEMGRPVLDQLKEESCYVQMTEAEFNALPKKQASTRKNNLDVYTVNDFGGVTGLYHAYNPNAKWDWYKIGGRWQDLFLFKDGKRHTASCAKKLYDFDAMRQACRAKAAKEWEAQHDKDSDPKEREAFIEEECRYAIPCYAILDSTGWSDRVHSGCDDWAEHIREYIDKLDDNTVLTFVDYHI